jgi:N-acyl-D-aspartate/D-glutamate deacylase
MTMEDPFTLNVADVVAQLMRGTREERISAYRDPAWRKQALEELGGAMLQPRWHTFEVAESSKFPELVGRKLEDIARERGVGPLDAMIDISLDEDLKTRFRLVLANDDEEGVGWLLTREGVTLGLSDAGAHVGQLCDAPQATDLLANWVRERPVLPVETAVRMLSGQQADIFGFEGRGYLREGYKADVAVFDLETVSPGPIRRVRDFPANAERLTADQPTGMTHVLVNGTPIQQDGESLVGKLESRPGQRPAIV